VLNLGRPISADHAFDPGPNGPSHPRAAVAEGPADRVKTFSHQNMSRARTELILFIRPTVIKDGVEEMRTKMNSTLVGTCPSSWSILGRPRVSAWSIERSSVQYFLPDAEKPNPCGATCCQIPSSR
jgi:hypothetical protein